MVYTWHPWAGCHVQVHEVIERATGQAARCTLGDTPVAGLQEIPVWMLDPVACGATRAVPQPVAILSALMSLRALLAAVVGGADHALRPSKLASPESSGDRHATASAPTAPVRSTARTRPDTRTVDTDAAGLERLIGELRSWLRLVSRRKTCAPKRSEPDASRTTAPIWDLPL